MERTAMYWVWVRLIGMICLVIVGVVISYISSMLTIVSQTKTVTIVLVKPRCTFLNGV